MAVIYIIIKNIHIILKYRLEDFNMSVLKKKKENLNEVKKHRLADELGPFEVSKAILA